MGDYGYDLSGAGNFVDLTAGYCAPHDTPRWEAGGVYYDEYSIYSQISPLDLTACNQITVVAGVGFDSLASLPIIGTHSSVALIDGALFAQLEANGKVKFDANTGGFLNYHSWRTNTQLTVGQKCQIAFSVDRTGGGVVGYLNGCEDGGIISGNGVCSGSFSNHTLYVGNWDAGTSNSMDGAIYYLFIFGRILPPADIAWLHREPWAAFDSPLITPIARGGLYGRRPGMLTGGGAGGVGVLTGGRM